jgi:hypothetical protein
VCLQRNQGAHGYGIHWDKKCAVKREALIHASCWLVEFPLTFLDFL